MAKAKGSTTKAGSVRTQRIAQDVTARIEGPHTGKPAKKVGAQTQSEADALRGIPRDGKAPKQVGPSEIRQSGKVGSPDSVKVVGGGDFEDKMAREGGEIRSPGVRQSGAVKNVGPNDIGYEQLTTNLPPVVGTEQVRFAPKRGDRIDKGAPLLKSGVGRAHAWSVYAGSPGSQPTGSGRRAFATDSLLINGRKRAFGPEAFNPRRDLVTPKSVIVPGGGTRRY